ncbi:MAG TPA: hypothetical protein PLE19_12680 [Planctomycetota bacterium]|nr:hypothetical protein [Planctomycetota bacterium]HRT95530.1 hypothetical protein [Planctomycetota bacterium]
MLTTLGILTAIGLLCIVGLALSADTPYVQDVGEIGWNELPVLASTTIYEGAMVGMQTSSGYARGLVAGDVFRGHARQKADNSAGANGAINVSVLRGRYLLRVTLANVAITDVGKTVFASADDTLTLTQATGSRVGVIRRYVTTNTCIVEFQTEEGIESDIPFVIGANANTAGSAPVLSATRTAIARLYSDDGGAAIVGDVRTLVTRFLITADQSASALSGTSHKGQIVIAADAKSGTDTHGGQVGTIEGKGTSGHPAEAGGWVNAGLVGIVDMPQYSDAASGKVVSGLAAAGVTLAGLTAGRVAAIHVPTPIAGSWGQFANLGSGTDYACGAKIASITGAPTDGTADGVLKINVAGTDYYVLLFTAAHVTGE